MKMSKPTSSKRKADLPDALLAHSRGRTDDVTDKLRRAMKVIEAEIEENEGIYGFNGGRLSLAEVCRRANVFKSTVQGPAHRDTTKPMVQKWIKLVKKASVTGSKSVRKAVTSRIDDWKDQYKALAEKCHIYFAVDKPIIEAALISEKEKVSQLLERNAFLEEEVQRLAIALSEGKVVRLSRKG